MIPNAITTYLERNQAQYSLVAHPTAYTAQEEAAVSHTSGDQWAKTVVCFADNQPVLAVVPASFAVDLNQLQRSTHAKAVRLAKESEFASFYQECELGAMPPFGPLFGQQVFVDKHLTTDPEVTFSAGSHREALRMPYREFERLAQPTVAEFAVRPPRSPFRETTLIDPVCGARLVEDGRAARSEYRGITYWFCSLCCKMEFDDNPYAYAREKG
jgi:Ala-tRNA(Pro) deacylase